MKIQSHRFHLFEFVKRLLTLNELSCVYIIMCSQTFLQELLNQQFKVLHPLSSFQRRSFSLSLLQLMAAIFDEPNSSSASNPSSSEPTSSEIPSIFDFPSAISSRQARCLLEGLLDPFDANRSVCLELLLKLDANLIKLTVRKYFSNNSIVSLSVLYIGVSIRV